MQIMETKYAFFPATPSSLQPFLQQIRGSFLVYNRQWQPDKGSAICSYHFTLQPLQHEWLKSLLLNHCCPMRDDLGRLDNVSERMEDPLANRIYGLP